ncbi:hypothetical protein T552_00732 [Pneumocystis carinii B80]|uniref:Uncharacterized protein n=1 Tax=Pneumocystis carinii (strain B80) TaxID=1408658 RepID=A0A0W4ZPH5_PNEC8|nr:hypothetical protein T552_00732 [Pneumocystis carinii B80]KTW30255.1 hypothetical protein T552_00732 [Pneumocystis carinii B80]
MAHNNTIYYLNSQESDLDNEILMSPCSKAFDNDMEYSYYDNIPLTCTVTPLKQFGSSSEPQKYVLCEYTPPAFAGASLDASALASGKYDPAGSSQSSSLESDSGFSVLRERLICGVWWKEFGVEENNVLQSVSINENNKVLCRGITTFSKNEHNIYIIGDICNKPYLKQRLAAIIDFASNFLFCNKLFIRIRKVSSGLDALIRGLTWIGFRIVPSASFSSEYYLLFSICL